MIDKIYLLDDQKEILRTPSLVIGERRIFFSWIAIFSYSIIGFSFSFENPYLTSFFQEREGYYSSLLILFSAPYTLWWKFRSQEIDNGKTTNSSNIMAFHIFRAVMKFFSSINLFAFLVVGLLIILEFLFSDSKDYLAFLVEMFLILTWGIFNYFSFWFSYRS